MSRKPSLLGFVVLSTLAAPFTGGCSGSGNQAAGAQVLDPTQSHYGHTDSEWGALWWQWIYQLPQTDPKNCIIPLQDPTGANCGYNQSGDVFFLAGTTGGTVVRDKCVVPSGKAIFFPILSFSADNAGVPTAMLFTDSALMGAVQNQMAGVPVSGLSAEFDGLPIEDLGRFQTQITQFNYTLPPEPNVYTCEGTPGVTGLVTPSYAAGFYIMLPPPASGAHVLHFAGGSPNTNPKIMVDVTYKFTIP